MRQRETNGKRKEKTRKREKEMKSGLRTTYNKLSEKKLEKE